MNELFTIARNEIHAKLLEEYKSFLHVLSLLTHLNIIKLARGQTLKQGQALDLTLVVMLTRWGDGYGMSDYINS